MYTLKNGKMQALQDEMVKRIIATIGDFDNFYPYEICNEPYFAGPTLEWQRYIAKLITDTGSAKVEAGSDFSKHRQWLPEDTGSQSAGLDFQFPCKPRPPGSVAMNYGLNRVIGINETGFDGTGDDPYRIEAWDFLIAGGALYSNLDYSFVAGYEDRKFHG